MAQPADVHSVKTTLKRLTNDNLKKLLREESLPVSGVKSALQGRLMEQVDRLAQAGNIDAFNRLKRGIYTVGRVTYPATNTTPYPPPHHHHQTPSTTGSRMPSQYSPGRLNFKESPFYSIQRGLVGPVELKIRENTKDTCDVKLSLDQTTASQLQNDPTWRVMVFCAVDNGLNHYQQSDIAFPHQMEIKVNLDEVKANLRGLKNKAGSTRPADITDLIRKRPGYPNAIALTYALTSKASPRSSSSKYFVMINLVKKQPVEALVAKLKAGRIISKEQVLREMRSKAEDADIVATSTVMSLKCPLSTLRIEVPCRSINCTHNQCFDASSFLQLQEQAPTWTCPVCSKTASFQSLNIDQYVNEILLATPRSVEQVTIEPDGRWSPHTSSDSSHQNGVASSPDDDDDDDDLVEIQDVRISSLKHEPHSTNFALHHTPPLSSREPSISSSGAPQSATRKRPASQVIDLTGSSDEDEGPIAPRPAKRPSYGLNGAVPNPTNTPASSISFSMPRPSSHPPPPPPPNFSTSYYDASY